MAKLCKYCGKYPVFSHGYCIYHQTKRLDDRSPMRRHRKPQNRERPSTPSQKNKASQLNHRSPKRKKQEGEYNRLINEFVEWKKQQGEYRCVFCGGGFSVRPDVHHLEGRDNDRLLDWTRWELAHRGCHQDYHSKPIEKLPWWDGYLERIKDRPQLYKREKQKEEK
jgi:hypothetical protein